MDFIRAISATCDDMLEDVIENELSNVRLQSIRYQQQLEELLRVDSNFNVLIFKENFPLNCHPLNFIKYVKETYPQIRVVFIMTSIQSDDVDKYTTYLHSKQIYDIIHDSEFGREELLSALFEPKTAQDAYAASKNMSFEEEFMNINTMEQKAANGFEEINESTPQQDIQMNYNNNISYSYPSSKVVAFWSPKGGTGVDTLAISTAMMLAKNTTIDVCIADFSDSPNMHLHFNMMDIQKNIENMYSYQAEGKLNVYTVDNFIVNGMSTNFNLPNLHILPGAIKRINFYDKSASSDGRSFVGNCIETIIDILREKYTIVILILSSNINNIPTIAGLRKCSQINMVLENDASCFYNANRFLHQEYGIFRACKVDSSKIQLILNKSYVKDNFYIDNFLKMNNLNINASVPLLPDEAFRAFKTANPLAFIESGDDAKYGILSVVNTITTMTINNSQPESLDKKNFLGGLFKGKKK